MNLPIYQIDAFTSVLFRGNPAAVCPLEDWLPDDRMQQIAAENNLSETAFFVPEGDGFGLRWFSPTTEVELCGHATLASAFVIWSYLGGKGTLRFRTRSGILPVDCDGDRIVLDFPARKLLRSNRPPEALFLGLGAPPDEVLASGEAEGSGFWVAVYPVEQALVDLAPDMRALSSLGRMGVVATAPGELSDFASRCFAPTFGIEEDPVTGSTHCFLAPLWEHRLGKRTLHARQVSERGGELFCEVVGDRVRIGGHARCFLRGTIEIPD